MSNDLDPLLARLERLLDELYLPAGKLRYVAHKHGLLDGRTVAEAIVEEDINGLTSVADALEEAAEMPDARTKEALAKDRERIGDEIAAERRHFMRENGATQYDMVAKAYKICENIARREPVE